MVSVRFTEAEYEHLCRLREGHGDESVSELLRSLAAKKSTSRRKRSPIADGHDLSEQRLEALYNWLTARDSREIRVKSAANGK